MLGGEVPKADLDRFVAKGTLTIAKDGDTPPYNQVRIEGPADRLVFEIHSNVGGVPIDGITYDGPGGAAIWAAAKVYRSSTLDDYSSALDD